MADENHGGGGSEPQARRPGEPMPPPSPPPAPLQPQPAPPQPGQPMAQQPRAAQPQPQQPQGSQPTSRLPGQQEAAQRASEIRYPTITVEPSTARATPDQQTELLLGITNRSDTVNEFTVELDDPSVGWIRIDPPSRNIWPGSRDTFRIIIQPPRSTAVRAGWKEYGLRIRSDGIPDGETTASIRVEVLPFEAVQARIVPRTSSGYRKGSHRVEVQNLGSAPWTADMGASDPDDVLRFQVPRQVMAMPGETLNVPVAVRPKALTFVGSTAKHDFTVSLQRDGGTPIKVDASFAQRAFIPSRLIPPLLVVGAAAIALALFAGGILPPKSGGTAQASSTPAASVAIVTSPSPTSSPTEAPTESPSAEISAPPSASPTLNPSVPPDGVAQWAWNRRIEHLTASTPFDPGDPVGPTQLTNDSMAELQLWTKATMYRPVGAQDGLTIRSPVLDKFREVSGDPNAPTTGYPVDNRKNDGNGRISQPFTMAGIACANSICVVMDRKLFDAWFKWRSQIGFPTADVASSSDPIEVSIARTEQGKVVHELSPLDQIAVCDATNTMLEGDDSGLCLDPPTP